MSDNKMVITIDGPSGSGKSTISRILASRLHYTYLDTGAMYRAVGFQAKRQSINLEDESGCAQLPELLDNMHLTLSPAENTIEETRVFLDGEDISTAIRTAEMGLIASRISAEPIVRQKLTEMQRRMGEQGEIVAEGRDTGTVVFPKAEVKFFLDAAPEERARRRQQQLQRKGQQVDFQELLQQIIKRDNDDSARSLAPLKPAADAIIVDSSKMTIEDVVSFMLSKVTGATQNNS